jgi:putative heme transporter
MNSSGGGRPNHDLRAIAGTLVGLGVVAFVFAYVLPRIADYREVWAVVQSLSWWWILALVAASACFVLSDGLPWIVVLPRLGFLNALRMDLAGSALSQVLPGGAAVNAATQFGMLKRWGYEGRPVVLAVSLTSIWNQIAVYAFPVLALVWLSLEGGSDRRLNTVALTALAVLVVIVAGLAVVLSSDRLARSTGDRLAKAATWLRRRIHKSPVGWGGESFVRFRHEANDLLRHRWPALTVATLVNQLIVFVVLVLELRAEGVGQSQVSIAEAFAAWSLVRALGSIPITPGGLGIVEVALSGALVGFGAGHAQAVAATLVYRFLTVVPSVLLGLVSVATYDLQNPKLKLSRHSRPAVSTAESRSQRP